jgi:hypothetical protein
MNKAIEVSSGASFLGLQELDIRCLVIFIFKS